MMPFLGPAGQADTRLFLTVDTPESIAQAIELWDQYSGAPGLLAARSGAGDDRYTYDPERRVYTNTKTGRDVTDQQLRRYVKNVSDETSRRMRKDTQQLIAGLIMLTVWYSRMRSFMRALYKTIWILGIGGFVFDDDTQRNLFYLFTLLQFNYFDNFAEQIYSGTQPLNGFAMTRAGMYAGYGNGMHQNIELNNGETNGYTEARRILGMNEDHCTEKENPGSDRPGCIELAEEGWMPIRMMTPIGSAICYTSCHCRIQLR
jgi:hypothetical protein